MSGVGLGVGVTLQKGEHRARKVIAQDLCHMLNFFYFLFLKKVFPFAVCNPAWSLGRRSDNSV